MSKASARASTATSSISPSTPTAKARYISSLKRFRAVRRRSKDLTGGSLVEEGSAPARLLTQCIRACLGGRMLVKRFDCVADRCWRRTGAAKRVREGV